MGPNLVTSAELARIFGVSDSTIANWRRAGMPCEEKGRRGQTSRYDTVACINWWGTRLAGEDKALDLNLERARLAHHQANKTQVEESLLKGELVRTLDVIEVWSALYSSARAKLLALPRKLAAILIHAETQDEAEAGAEKEITAILGELSRSGLPRKVERIMQASGARLDTPATPHS